MIIHSELGKEAVDWLLSKHYFTTREAATNFGNKLFDVKIFEHVHKG
jgi:hypothetical protein